MKFSVRFRAPEELVKRVDELGNRSEQLQEKLRVLNADPKKYIHQVTDTLIGLEPQDSGVIVDSSVSLAPEELGILDRWAKQLRMSRNEFFQWMWEGIAGGAFK